MTETNAFANWERLLAGERLAINVNEPWTGFYKLRRGDNFVPCAYWRDELTGRIRCRIENKEMGEQWSLDAWPYAARAPVKYEDYIERIETGKWPGESSAVINHNAAPPDDSPEAIAERIADLAREAERMIGAGGAKDDATCDQASDLSNLLGEIEAKVSRLHKIEKEPALEASRAVDRKWFSLRDSAADLKRRLKAIVVTPWLTKKKAAADEAAAKAIASGAPIENVASVKVTAGSSKRSTALRTYFSAKINDRAALLSHLKDHPDIIACIQAIADAAAKKKISLPGCEILAEQRAA